MDDQYRRLKFSGGGLAVSDAERIFCNRCATETNHNSLYVYRDKFRDKALEELLRSPVRVVTNDLDREVIVQGEPDAEAWYMTRTELLKMLWVRFRDRPTENLDGRRGAHRE